MQLSSRLRNLSTFVILLSATQSSCSQSGAASHFADIPLWLKPHVGEGDGQIADVVLQRARALYLRKLAEGSVKNLCYFAMDATRPNDLGDGKAGRRFYVICESKKVFRAVSAGHGSGRHLERIADFSNGRTCAKNFGNALDSKLTTGGAYVTAEMKNLLQGLLSDRGKPVCELESHFCSI